MKFSTYSFMVALCLASFWVHSSYATDLTSPTPTPVLLVNAPPPPTPTPTPRNGLGFCEGYERWSMWVWLENNPGSYIWKTENGETSIDIYAYPDSQITVYCNLVPVYRDDNNEYALWGPGSDWSCQEGTYSWSDNLSTSYEAGYTITGLGSHTITGSYSGWYGCDGPCTPPTSIGGGSQSFTINVRGTDEMPLDSDGDGTPNYDDLDDDNDGILDSNDFTPAGLGTIWHFYPAHLGGGRCENIPTSSPYKTVITGTYQLPSSYSNVINYLSGMLGLPDVNSVLLSASQEYGYCCESENYGHPVVKTSGNASITFENQGSFSDDIVIVGKNMTFYYQKYGVVYTIGGEVGVWLSTDLTIGGSVSEESNPCDGTLCRSGTVSLSTNVTVSAGFKAGTCTWDSDSKDCACFEVTALQGDLALSGNINFGCPQNSLSGEVLDVPIYSNLRFGIPDFCYFDSLVSGIKERILL